MSSEADGGMGERGKAIAWGETLTSDQQTADELKSSPEAVYYQKRYMTIRNNCGEKFQKYLNSGKTGTMLT